MSEWLKIQYLWRMLNNIHCVSDEKDSRKHVYIVYFSRTWILKMRKKDQPKFTANATLRTYKYILKSRVVEFKFYVFRNSTLWILLTQDISVFVSLVFYVRLENISFIRGDVTIARNENSSIRERSLSCHTCCDTVLVP